jgi:hypothetical protein
MKIAGLFSGEYRSGESYHGRPSGGVAPAPVRQPGCGVCQRRRGSLVRHRCSRRAQTGRLEGHTWLTMQRRHTAGQSRHSAGRVPNGAVADRRQRHRRRHIGDVPLSSAWSDSLMSTLSALHGSMTRLAFLRPRLCLGRPLPMRHADALRTCWPNVRQGGCASPGHQHPIAESNLQSRDCRLPLA